MLTKKTNKTHLKLQVVDFFTKIINQDSKQVKKMKKQAMSQNVHLKKLRKGFCKYCLTPYTGKETIRINNKVKNIKCCSCGKINRWKIK